MRIALLSDAHVDALDDPVQARLVAFLDALDADRLVLAGDTFHRWWGLGPGIFSAYVPTVAALGRLTRRGVAVDLLRGNHDFALDEGFGADLGVRVADALDLDADGLRLRVEHGDRAVRQRRYHAYHGLLRGPLFDLGLRLAGPRRAWAVLGRLAGSPVKQGRCPERLLEEQRAHARALLAAGADLVVLGHCHMPGEHAWPGGRYLNLGSFRDQGTWAELDGGTLRLRSGFPEHARVDQDPLGALDRGQQGAFGEDHGQVGGLPEPGLDAREQGAAAGEHDPGVQDVRGQLR